MELLAFFALLLLGEIFLLSRGQRSAFKADDASERDATDSDVVGRGGPGGIGGFGGYTGFGGGSGGGSGT